MKFLYKVNEIGLSEKDSHFLAHLRSVSILMIVLGHVGLGWFFRPWSGIITDFVAMFFFISGAVLFHSYKRSKTLSNFYWKRLLSLYVPYFLLCVLSLIVYIFLHKGQVPQFDLRNFLSWVQIRPNIDLMPFNIGQVWFLHTLFVISIISPVIFFAISDGKFIYLWIIVSFLLLLSAIQLFYDVDNYFFIQGNNLYKPLIHTIFFSLGAWCFSGNEKSNYERKTYFIFACVCVTLCVLLVNFLFLDIGYDHHTYAPDLYYVIGSLASISIFMSFKDLFMWFVSLNNYLLFFFKVLYVYTMPIYLLHSFSIFVCENIFGLVHPKNNFVIYGISKFLLVMTLTLLISYPFLRLSKYLICSLDILLRNVIEKH